MKLKKLFIGAGVCTAGVGLAVGTTFGVWSASGSGSGAGLASIAKSLVVTAVTPTGSAASLYPGGPAGPVLLTIQNPNPYAVTVSGLQWGTPVSTSTASCPSSNISLDPNAPTSVSISIPANTTTATQQIAGVLDLSHNAPDGCQGVEFLIQVTATGAQQ